MDKEILIDALMFVFNFFRHEAEDWIAENDYKINYINITDFASAVREVQRLNINKL